MAQENNGTYIEYYELLVYTQISISGRYIVW